VNKTIYIRDEDEPIWEKAKTIAGAKGLSSVIVESIKTYVERKEALAEGFERIEIAYSDADAAGLPKRKAFYGRWVFPFDKPLTSWADDEERQYSCAVAITRRGAVVTCGWYGDDESMTFKRFRIYSSMEEAAADMEDNWAILQAMEKIGVPVEELDI
jgi:predicted CopG family antitoxin